MSISAVGNGKLDPVYRDRKRWAWLLSVVFPLLPLLGVWLHHVSGWEIALVVQMVISYGFMPILDALIGEDLNNPPEAGRRPLLPLADLGNRAAAFRDPDRLCLVGWHAASVVVGICDPGLQRRCRGRSGAEHRP